MRVLYKPDNIVLRCKSCGTVLEFGVEEIDLSSHNLDWEVKCPTCKRSFDLDDVQHEPVDLKPEKGKCQFCSTPIAKGDKHCSSCGHTL
jgi:hypothetical protein